MALSNIKIERLSRKLRKMQVAHRASVQEKLRQQQLSQDEVWKKLEEAIKVQRGQIKRVKA